MGHLKAIKDMCISPKYVGGYDLFCLKDNCNKCGNQDICRLQHFLNTDFDLIAMTYSKVLLANQFESRDNSIINQKILNTDVIFMDEYSHAIHVSPYETSIDKLIHLHRKIFEKLSVGSQDIMIDFLTKINFHENNGHYYAPDGQFYYHDIINFGNIIKIAKSLTGLNLNPEENRTIKSFLSSISYDHFYIMDNMIIPDVMHPINAFNSLLYQYKGKVIITDALLPTTKMLKGTTIEWPAFKNNQAQQLIICDSRKAPFALYQTNLERYGRDYSEQIERLKRFLYNIIFNIGSNDGISNVETDDMKKKINDLVQIFAVNKGVAKSLERFDYKSLGLDALAVSEYPRISSSYYRSDISAGVDMKKRILIGINLPHTSSDSMKGYAKVFADLPEYQHLDANKVARRVKLHEQIRRDEIQNTFYNTIGRVKDKNGIEKSVAIIFGDTKEETLKHLPSDTNWNIVSTTGGNFILESYLMTQLWMNNAKNPSDSDVPVMQDFARIYRGMIEHPQVHYKYRKFQQDIHINGIEGLFKEHGHLLPFVKSNSDGLSISGTDYDRLKIMDEHYRNVNKAVIKVIRKSK